ncbi:MAG: ATP synthase subunit I [Gallionella sp.]
MTSWMTFWAGSKRANKLTKVVEDIEQECLTPSEIAAIIPALLDVEAKERKIARQVVWLQIVVVLTAASIVYGTNGTPQFASAVLSGGGVSAVNGAMLAWRMSRSALHTASEVSDPRAVHQQLRLLYFYAAERYLVVVTLLGLCMAVMKLPPLALLAGFATCQTVLLVARLLLRQIKTEIANKNV